MEAEAEQVQGELSRCAARKAITLPCITTCSGRQIGHSSARLARRAGSPWATAHTAFVHAAQLFDAGRFGVSPAEAAAMDPQQRLLLERGYEALHAAADLQRLITVSPGGTRRQDVSFAF